ncbi:MAG: DUF4202 domain-containing protein [Alphaproteobacteria bacterium]
MTADPERFPERFNAAIAAIDGFNAGDPNRETFQGKAYPKEVLYAERMTAWLEKLNPKASEELRLATRAQHIGRWTIARADYPQGLAGYSKWRGTLARFHADTAAHILGAAGYGEGAQARVVKLIRKLGLGTDPETQMLEDVICLVFLEHYFSDFSAKHEDTKIVDILQKTWAKMSPRGHELALELASGLAPDRRALIVRAVKP